MKLKSLVLAMSAGLFTLNVQAAPDLSKETEAYKQFVIAEMDALLAETEKFAAYLHEGDVENAKKLYPVARLHFERSEPIAESFGDLDPRIDARLVDILAEENIVDVPEAASAEVLQKTMDGVPADKLKIALDKWSGFHKIEKVLWEDNTTQGTEETAQQLVNDVKELRAKIPTVDVTPELMMTGAIDLLNEVSTTKITGEENIFSKKDLFDFKANIEGAEKIFVLFKPHVEAKDKALAATIEAQFKAVNDLLAKHNQAGDGGYDFVDYDTLSADDIKALAEAVNKLGEPLAQMGIILE